MTADAQGPQSPPTDPLDQRAAAAEADITTDEQTTVARLRQMVRTFVQDRDWRQFHAPKNVAMGIAIEAAELMEHFQWIDGEPSRRVVDDPELMTDIGEELADIVCYCLALANELELDISQIMRQKMAKNRRKYPATRSRGRFDPPPPDES